MTIWHGALGHLPRWLVSQSLPPTLTRRRANRVKWGWVVMKRSRVRLVFNFFFPCSLSWFSFRARRRWHSSLRDCYYFIFSLLRGEPMKAIWIAPVRVCYKWNIILLAVFSVERVRQKRWRTNDKASYHRFHSSLLFSQKKMSHVKESTQSNALFFLLEIFPLLYFCSHYFFVGCWLCRPASCWSILWGGRLEASDI